MYKNPRSVASTSTKRRCTRTSLDKPALHEVDWERLPHVATVHIFSYLRDRDRIAVSQVCCSWNYIFKDPSLWRTKKFFLNGFSNINIKRNQCNVCFASTFGRFLHEVVIECSNMPFVSDKINLLETLKTLLVNMKNARLRQFHLTDLRLDLFKEVPKLTNAVYSSLIKLFEFQGELNKVNMRCCHFNLLSGTKVLKQLAASSGDEIKDLDIMDYLKNDFFYNLYDMEPLQKIITNFTNLSNISIDYSFLSDTILRHWSVVLRHKLEFICIQVSCGEPHSHVLSNGTWRELSSSCPKLVVRVILNGLPEGTPIIKLVPPCMPLNHIKLRLFWNLVQETQLPVVLKHLTDCFQHRLQSFSMLLELVDDYLDDELIYLLERCRQLRSLALFGNFGIRVVNTVFDLLNFQYNSPILRCVRIGLNEPGTKRLIAVLRKIQARMFKINGVTSDGRSRGYFSTIGRCYCGLDN